MAMARREKVYWYGRRREGEERRRKDALKRQEGARREMKNVARRLAGVNEEMEEEEEEREGGVDDETRCEILEDVDENHMRRYERERRYDERQLFSGQLMQPEWLIDIPGDIRSWLVLARPEGKRCLVIASRGKTISRSKNGSIMHTFQSQLPDGSSYTAGRGYCILDCIYHDQNRTYYIIDAMCWKAYLLYDCSAEFRFFWLKSKFEEHFDDLNINSRVSDNYSFSLVSVQKVGENAGGLDSAYDSINNSYVTDGILLYNSESKYEPGISPLTLQWKDAISSRYLLDTNADGSVSQFQNVVLRVNEKFDLLTEDSPPVALGRMSEELLAQFSEELSPGMLLRFQIGPQGIQFLQNDNYSRSTIEHKEPFLLCTSHSNLSSVDLQLIGKGNQRRGTADSFSKIVFQFLMRHLPHELSIEVLRSAATNSERKSVRDMDSDIGSELEANSLVADEDDCFWEVTDMAVACS